MIYETPYASNDSVAGAIHLDRAITAARELDEVLLIRSNKVSSTNLEHVLTARGYTRSTKNDVIDGQQILILPAGYDGEQLSLYVERSMDVTCPQSVRARLLDKDSETVRPFSPKVERTLVVLYIHTSEDVTGIEKDNPNALMNAAIIEMQRCGFNNLENVDLQFVFLVTTNLSN